MCADELERLAACLGHTLFNALEASRHEVKHHRSRVLYDKQLDKIKARKNRACARGDVAGFKKYRRTFKSCFDTKRQR